MWYIGVKRNDNIQSWLRAMPAVCRVLLSTPTALARLLSLSSVPLWKSTCNALPSSHVNNPAARGHHTTTLPPVLLRGGWSNWRRRRVPRNLTLALPSLFGPTQQVRRPMLPSNTPTSTSTDLSEGLELSHHQNQIL